MYYYLSIIQIGIKAIKITFLITKSITKLEFCNLFYIKKGITRNYRFVIPYFSDSYLSEGFRNT